MSTDLREELDALARTQTFSPDPSAWDRGRRARRRTRVAAGMAAVAVVAVVAVGAGALVALLLGVDSQTVQNITIIGVGALMIFYVVVGGMKGTTYVQIVKAVMLMIGSALIVVLVLVEFNFNLSSSARPPTTPARARRSSSPDSSTARA